MKGLETRCARLRRALLAASCPAILWAAPLAAQESAGSGSGVAPSADTQDIVVTAERRETRLQETPIAITVFTGAALEDKAITNMSDLNRFTPNAVITSTNRPAGGGGAIAAYIRGVGSGDYLFPLEPGVGVYIDSVYVAKTAGGLMDIVDIDRIEVLKGPQGTLFGRNTVGGAISIVTQRPHTSGELTGSAEVRLGQRNQRDFLGSINAPLVDDLLGIKLGIGRFNTDGYGRQLTANLPTGGTNRWVGKGALRLTPSSDLTIDLTGDYSRQRNKGRPTYTYRDKIVPTYQRYNEIAVPVLNEQLGLPADTIVDFRFNSPGPYSAYGEKDSDPHDDYDIYGIAFNVAYQLSDQWSLRSISAYRHVRTYTGGGNASATPYPILGNPHDGEHVTDRQISQEFQLAGSAFDGRLSVLIGAYGFWENGNRHTATHNFHGLYEVTHLERDAKDTFTYNDYSGQSYSIFTQETIKLNDLIDIVAGARYTVDHKRLFQYSIFTQLDKYQVPPRNYKDTWEKFTPKIGINLHPKDDLLLYATYSVGYKSGGWSPNGTNPLIPDPAFAPETLTSYEAGVKSQWFDRRLTVNAASFYSLYKDIQLTVQVPDPDTGVNLRTTQNAGDAKLYGFEVEATAQPVRGLSFQVGIGYIHDKFTKLTAGAIASGAEITDKLASIPKWNVNLAVDWHVPTGIGDITLHGDSSYRSGTYLTLSDELSYQKGYTLYGARVSLEPRFAENLTLSVIGTNLSNKYYFTYAAYQAAGGQFIAVPAVPRAIYGSIKYKF